jgi:hypothetical protein
MLELFLDKEFANNYHLVYQGEKVYVDDFQNYFLKEIKNLTLITNYFDFEDLTNKVKENAFLEHIIGCIPKIIYHPDLLNEINSKEFPDIGSPFKLILTGQKTDVCNYRRKRFGLEFINPTNLSDRWQLHYSRRIDMNRKTTKDSEIPDDQRFDSWEKIKSFSHPLNSIILIDRYLLKWKTKKEFEKDLKNNILPLFKNLLIERADETPIEIMIVSEFEENPKEDSIRESHSRLVTRLREETKKVINLNLIAYKKFSSKTIYPFHDRLIITNYFYIESGAGFKIFDNNGIRETIETNTEIKFRSIFNIQNVFSVLYDLKQLGIYCKKQENSPARMDSINYYPKVANRLLNIEHSK